MNRCIAMHEKIEYERHKLYSLCPDRTKMTAYILEHPKIAEQLGRHYCDIVCGRKCETTGGERKNGYA